jgi:hypothetical protein
MREWRASAGMDQANVADVVHCPWWRAWISSRMSVWGAVASAISRAQQPGTKFSSETPNLGVGVGLLLITHWAQYGTSLPRFAMNTECSRTAGGCRGETPINAVLGCTS